ncbi:MAG: hypothetical protein FP814_05345, partial [Desulfobacterium sp.]|nr:hypothetical protein [Desulfobacterium sp.]MBU4036757.1 hypothetical protein [Pseudomonadota bacterium]
MRKYCILALTGILLLFSNGILFAADYYYTPSPGDLGDLDHTLAYSWGINLANKDIYNHTLNLNTESIAGASLFFSSIYNWDNNYNILQVSLLDDSVTLGVKSFPDNQNPTNYFAGKYDSKLLFSWENMSTKSRNVAIGINTNTAYTGQLKDGVADGATLYMPANSLNNLIAYASAGIFGLGFDPDCHYYNCGIK